MKTRIPFRTSALLAALAVAGSTIVTPIAIGAAPRPAAVYASLLDMGDWQLFSLSGTIKSVDYVSNIVVVRLANADIETVRITPTTTVEHGGQTASIGDLRRGAHVRIKGTIRDGELTAESIVVK